MLSSTMVRAPVRLMAMILVARCRWDRAQTGKPFLFISASAPDSAFQACINQFEIKDGNRLRSSGSAANEQ